MVWWIIVNFREGNTMSSKSQTGRQWRSTQYPKKFVVAVSEEDFNAVHEASAKHGISAAFIGREAFRRGLPATMDALRGFGSDAES